MKYEGTADFSSTPKSIKCAFDWFLFMLLSSSHSDTEEWERSLSAVWVQIHRCLSETVHTVAHHVDKHAGIQLATVVKQRTFMYQTNSVGSVMDYLLRPCAMDGTLVGQLMFFYPVWCGLLQLHSSFKMWHSIKRKTFSISFSQDNKRFIKQDCENTVLLLLPKIGTYGDHIARTKATKCIGVSHVVLIHEPILSPLSHTGSSYVFVCANWQSLNHPKINKDKYPE